MSCIRRLWPSGAVTWTRAAAGVAQMVGFGQLSCDPTRDVRGSVKVTSSVSANGGEALCGSPFSQVAADRRGRS
jgi:hypothetical protein